MYTRCILSDDIWILVLNYLNRGDILNLRISQVCPQSLLDNVSESRRDVNRGLRQFFRNYEGFKEILFQVAMDGCRLFCK